MKQFSPASRKGRLFFLAGVIAVAAVSAGCSTSDPEILRIDTDRLFVLDSGNGEPAIVEEYLAVFVDVFDADGREEVAELHLYHDATNLHWEVPESAWAIRDTRDAYWIGYDRFAMPGFAPFPSGTYRVVVRDLSSSEAETMLLLGDDATPSLDRVANPDAGSFIVPGTGTVLACGPEPLYYRVSSGALSAADRKIVSSNDCTIYVAGDGVVTATPVDRNAW